ncbi:DUF1849 family protein [Rhodobacteraceae bacterium RKSG542]|uniref:cell envelope integrity EipB family protein n=1 Tax=Pseudovibrio flavus TaxID=2529854 RepID=UPI0012BB8C39|nr:cell envelope integrity EipB family protein [Pseudovibrio flavus]MTI16389.1 DUF1849 family protein [Pseudovibrio flavus]
MPILKNLQSSSAFRVGAFAVPFLGAVALGPSQYADAAVLDAHRAVYDIKLLEAADGSNISDIKGRMVYELTGNACEGHNVAVRFILLIQGVSGEKQVTDLQSTSFEGAKGKSFRFTTKTFVNDFLAEQVEGSAQLGSQAVDVELVEPAQKSVSLSGDILFPTQHLSSLIDAAMSGERFIAARVYDGSETGEKVFDTASTIGLQRGLGGAVEGDDKSAVGKIGEDTFWPVTIAYFDPTKDGPQGELLPDYQLNFLLHENGVSRSLVLDYGTFKMNGHLVRFEDLTTDECSASQG